MKVKHFALGFALGLLLSACSNQGVSTHSAGLGAQDDAVIGGQPGDSPLLNAVGTIGTMVEGKYSFFCTASLIGSSTVLTAKHCVQTSSGPRYDQEKVFFALGNTNQPTRLVQVVAGELAKLNSGGISGGSDVAALNLLEPITDVAPLTLADRAMATSDLGRKLLSAGFGPKNAAQEQGSEAIDGDRAMGLLTANALEGKAFEHIFGSWDAFKAYCEAEYGADVVADYLPEFQAWYDDTVLLKDYDLWAGAQPGDARMVAADVGGPLILTVKTRTGIKTSLYGVLSDVFASSTNDYGSFYALLGPSATEAISKAQAWVDPCVGESVTGRCDGTVAIRSSDLGEGPRHMLQNDCADLDQVCVFSAAGTVGCDDVQPPTPSE